MQCLQRKVAIVSEDWDVIELLKQDKSFNVVGCFSKEVSHQDCIVNLGTDDFWLEYRAKNNDVEIVLAVDLPILKERLYSHYGGSKIISVFASNSFVSKYANIGNGSIVQMKSIIMPHVKTGLCCKFHINTTIHHDVEIGDFCTIAPGALLLGNVKLGNRVYVGAGAIIKQRCVINDDCIIGAGAVVVKDVPKGRVVVGVPARALPIAT